MRMPPRRAAIGGIVIATVGLGGAIIAAADADDDLTIISCASDMRSHDVLEYVDDKTSVYPTAEAAVGSSDIWKFKDVPIEDWRVVDDGAQDGIVPIDPSADGIVDESESLGVREFAVRQGGETRIVLTVEPVGDGFRVSEMAGC